MIFVAVGTQRFQFNRLLISLDALIGSGEIKEDLFAQTGYSDYKPRQYPYAHFLDDREFQARVEASEIVIAHAGMGIILSCMAREKPVIVVPRLKRYGEHIDDHQREIAEQFYHMHYVIICQDCRRLSESITLARHYKVKAFQETGKRIEEIIGDYIEHGKKH